MPPFRRYLSKTKGGRPSKGPVQKVFYGSRLAELDQSQDEATSGPAEQDDAEELSELSSSEEDEGLPSQINPYHALLQSLNSSTNASEPKPKRRKIANDAPIPLPPPQKIAALENVDDINGNLEIDESEPEDQPDEGALDELRDEDLDEDDPHDPFQTHLDRSEDSLAIVISEQKSGSDPPQKLSIGDDWKASAGGPRQCRARTENHAYASPASIRQLWIKEKLLLRAQKKLSAALSGVSTSFAKSVFNYEDILFGNRTSQNAGTLMRLATLHALNHVLKTRDRVIKNTTRLSKADASENLICRDQGYTRPKVLFLLPTRQACVRVVETMITFYDTEQQENKKRFFDSYSQKEDDISDDKPEDFRQLFRGNDDDLFRIGIKFTRKTIKLFSQFYASDIILASPLGLRMATTSKKEDYDFLSSIEVVIVDHADALLMQNWEHVGHIFTHLNLPLKEDHDCDFSRVRNWYLDGNAKYLRQTIVLSAFLTPELNQLFSQHMQNVAGRVKLASENPDGIIASLAGSGAKQTFMRFDSLSLSAEPDARFKAFTATIVSGLVKLARSSPGSSTTHGILLFIPSYMDFVRVRNFLSSSSTTQSLSFGTISEYTSPPEVARVRSHFLSGRHAVLLYSGRAHHFKRYRIQGVRSVIMYALPENPLFYREVAGEYLERTTAEGLVPAEQTGVRSLFSRWDFLKLERVVGSKRVGAMMRTGSAESWDFV